MTRYLGCPNGYTVELRLRGGRAKAGTFTGITALTWERVLNGTSACQVTITPRGKNCARLINGAIPWAHELAVFRDRELVWCGPLIDKDDNGAQVTLSASDVSEWLKHRIVRRGYDTTSAPADLSAIAELVVRDGFGPDDPEVLPHLIVHPAGVTAERYADPETVMCDSELNDLSGLGLDWTVAGRAIVLFGAREPLGRVAALTGRHFATPLPITEAGSGVATRVVVQGSGVRGEAGGVHPVLGLLETLVSSDTVLTDGDAASAARAALVTPQLLLAGDGSLALAPRAPVTVAELIPGVACTVSGSGSACRTASAVQLTKLAVQWGTSGEAVAPSFVELADPALAEVS